MSRTQLYLGYFETFDGFNICQASVIYHYHLVYTYVCLWVSVVLLLVSLSKTC